MIFQLTLVNYQIVNLLIKTNKNFIPVYGKLPTMVQLQT